MLNNLRESEEFENLRELISTKSKNKHILYAPSLGNWGDALIHKGVLQFLDDNKFKYTTVQRPKIDSIRESLSGTNVQLQDTVLLNCGGGSWCKNFHGTRDFVSRNWSLFSDVIVMPSTFELPAVASEPANVTYISRDTEKSMTTIQDAVFCHDMALYLQLATKLGPGNESAIGYFMREDKERSHSAFDIGEGYDISLLGSHRSKITPFFQILNGYKKIVTDRMHVAIAGAMLGKEVELYSSDYFKAPAVSII